MTVCLKCGAENPLSSKYCGRCEMPLPNSGAGETLSGGTGKPVTVRGGAGRAGPVAIIGRARPPGAGAPEHAPVTAPGPVPPPNMLGGMVPRAQDAKGDPPAPLPQQTLFGIAPRGAAKPAPAPKPAEAAPTTEKLGQASPQRTLLGVMPGDLAKALDAVRASPPTRGGTSPLGPAPVPGGSPQHTLLGSAPSSGFETVRNTSTILGAAVASHLPDRPEPRREPSTTAPAEEAFSAASFGLPSQRGAGAPPTNPGRPAPLALPDVPSLPAPHAKTHMGVALPGIAPLRAGFGAAAAPAPAPPFQAAAPTPLEATNLAPQSALSGSSLFVPAPLRLPRSALILLGSGLVLLASAVAFAFFWQGAKPLSAVLAADASGRERIDLVCETCAAGTKVSLGESSAEFKERKAYLTPAQSLPLGANTLAFRLERPGTDAEMVDVALPPIEYRIQTDTSTLVGDQPRLTLKIEALPGTRVTLGEQAVALDASGHGQLALDVTGQLLGAASDVRSFEQSIRYAIAPPGGKEHQGELGVKISVTPLVLEAPGADTVTDLERFMLAGRTTKGAEVSIAGNPLGVDAAGRFSQLMSIDSVGETKLSVRATEPGLAPRFVPFTLRRVANLAAHAETLKQGALPLASVSADLDQHVGKKVLVRGKIAEVRIDGHRSILVLEADRDCEGSACLTRLIYGGLRKLQRGRIVTAIGTLRAGAGVPEIEVTLLL